MNTERLTIRRADEKDISLIQCMIKGLAAYEKRPQNMTGTQEKLKYWIFERKIATVLIAEYDGEAVGYALYYPIFGSFAAEGRVHLEDLFIKEEYRNQGIGKYFFDRIAGIVREEGYSAMEWSCLDWNEPAVAFYEKLGAVQEKGRKYFGFADCREHDAFASGV